MYPWTLETQFLWVVQQEVDYCLSFLMIPTISRNQHFIFFHSSLCYC